jgi:hypothetical protein
MRRSKKLLVKMVYQQALTKLVSVRVRLGISKVESLFLLINMRHYKEQAVLQEQVELVVLQE